MALKMCLIFIQCSSLSKCKKLLLLFPAASISKHLQLCGVWVLQMFSQIVDAEGVIFLQQNKGMDLTLSLSALNSARVTIVVTKATVLCLLFWKQVRSVSKITANFNVKSATVTIVNCIRAVREMKA